jgi:hypothetical protein
MWASPVVRLPVQGGPVRWPLAQPHPGDRDGGGDERDGVGHGDSGSAERCEQRRARERAAEPQPLPYGLQRAIGGGEQLVGEELLQQAVQRRGDRHR